MNTDPNQIENPAPHPGGCPSGKVEHPDMAAAERERDRLTTAYGLVFNAYHCELCGKYHTGKDRYANPPEVLNATMEEFRVVESEIGPVIPLKDVADRLGKDRSTLSRLTSKPENKALFEGLISTQTLETPRGRQPHKCITKEGLRRLIELLRPVARDGFAGKQAQYRLSTVEKPARRKAKTLDEDLDEAKHLAEKCGKPADLFLAVALRRHGRDDYAEALTAAPSLELIHGEPGWYNPKELLSLINDPLLTSERLNNYLKNKGYQFKDENYLWRLTDEGKKHGREYSQRGRGGHEEPRIEWRESILYASGLKRRASSDQIALPERASVVG